MKSAARDRGKKRTPSRESRFEKLLADLSTKFARLRSDQIDFEILNGLQQLLDLVDMDRGSIGRFHNGKLELTHSYARPGVPLTIPSQIKTTFPWFFSTLMAGKPVIVGRVPEDLPANAVPEREYCLSEGVRAICTIPILLGEQPFGIISAASFRQKKRWPAQVVKRMRLIGEIFANALLRKQNQQRMEDQLARLENQYQFEKLISELTAQFVNIQVEVIDQQIETSLEHVLAFLGQDRMALLKIIHGSTVQATVTHSANGDGIKAAPVDINYAAAYPWHAAKILAGETVSIHMKDLPAEAVVDRASAQVIGIQSNLVIPLKVNDTVEYVLATNAIRGERIWDDEILARIRLLGDIFVSALTRKKMVEQSRKQALDAQRHREELAHISRVSAAGELTASIAHELNQPLTGILSNAQAALRFISQDRTTSMDEVRDILEDIVDDNKRAGEIIRKLRSMIRKSDSEYVLLNVNEIVEEVLPLVKSDALIRNARISLHPGDGLPQVQGDRIQIQQVIMNLVLNSFDAIENVPQERRKVRIQTQEVNGRILISIRDCGNGIPQDKMDRIFEPFFTTRSHGLGMGLAISEKIVHAHGGSIVAANNPDHGATFSIYLPPKL